MEVLLFILIQLESFNLSVVFKNVYLAALRCAVAALAYLPDFHLIFTLLNKVLYKYTVMLYCYLVKYLNPFASYL
jgi:hypothetical protein